MKCRVLVRNGRLKFYPASLEFIETILRSLGQKVKYESIKPPASYMPLFQQAKCLRVGISIEQAKSMSLEQLWQIHDDKKYNNYGASLLDFKILILERLYQQCELCGHNCQVDRYKTKGMCGLGLETYYEYQGTLIGEENVINPSAGIALFGCVWNCSFCHAYYHISPKPGLFDGEPLDSRIWSKINYSNCNSVMFSSAGDPAPHALNILKVLKSAPESLNLPLIWNSNNYAASTLWKVINDLVDVHVIDMKFGNDKCAQELAGCKNHNHYAIETLNSLAKSSGRKIIRWLLLPGHLDCCGREIVNMTAKYNYYISLVDDFTPSYKMKSSRANTNDEIKQAKELISAYKLKDINSIYHAQTFWQ